MSIDLNTVSLPFDRWGTAATNKVVGERQTLTSVSWTEYNIIIPKYAPFFSESIDHLIHWPSGDILERGKHWSEGWYFQSASGEIGSDIHCCIYFYDAGLVGEIEIPSYQAMGGEWQLNGQKLTEILASLLLNPLRIYWEQVANLPEIFPPLDHDQDIQDFTKLGDLIDVLREIALAAGGGAGADLSAHLADLANPHKTNAFQVGLGKVMNWAVATLADIAAGNLNAQVYMNPVMTQNMINVAMGALTLHEQDFSNSHKVRADQTGAYFIAEVDALLESLAAGLIHNIYAYRLEGKSVDDIVAMVQSGSSGALDAVRAQITALTNELTLHEQRFDNPHKVTAAQVLAYTMAQIDSMMTQFAQGLIHDIYAYRLEGKSVDDIVSLATQAVQQSIANVKSDVLKAVSDTLATYQAQDTIKFSGKTEDQWLSVINGLVAAASGTILFPSIASVIPGRDPSDPYVANPTAYNATLIGTFDRYNREGDGSQGELNGAYAHVRLVMGDAAAQAISAQVCDVMLNRLAGGGVYYCYGGLPANTSLFLDDGPVAGQRRLWLRGAPNRPAVGVTNLSGSCFVPGDGNTPLMEGSTVYNPATYHTNKIALGGDSVALAGQITTLTTNLGTTNTNVSTLTSVATSLGNSLTALTGRVTKLETNGTVRYNQNKSINPGVQLTIDLQSLVPAPDVALYDYLGAKVSVRYLDAVAGSNTTGTYIDSQGTITTSIRGTRYLDVWNYDSVAVTVQVRVEIPLL